MKESVIIDKIKLNGVVYDSLELVDMAFDRDFTRQHFDIIYTLLSLYNDNGALSYKIKIKELLKIYDNKNPWRKGLIDEARKLKDILMKLYFDVLDKETNTYTSYHWVDKVIWPKNATKDDYIEIILHEDVKQFFTQMKEQNLVMSLKNILALSTLNQKRIYRWAYAKKGFKNAVPIAINDAKRIFIGNEDIRTVEFIRFYLKPAIEAINEKTDLYIEYEPVRADPTYQTKITSLKFKIHCDYERKAKKERTASQIASDARRTQSYKQQIADQDAMIALMAVELNEKDRIIEELESRA